MSDESQVTTRRALDAGDVRPDDCNAREWPGAASQREPGFQVLVRRSVLNDVHAHAHSYPNAEICGVLVGDVVADNHGPFLYVEASIRGEFASSQIAAVTFTAETWTYMQGVLDKQHPGKRIVGWYHSHPDFGIFLSEMDLFIHRHFFNLAWQVALVYDPIRSEEGMFIWRGGVPTRESFVVEEDTNIVTHTARAASAPDDTRPDGNWYPVNPELLALRSRLRWLSAGVIMALLISVLWPVVLIVASKGALCPADIIRLLGLPATSTSSFSCEEPDQPRPPQSESAGETPPDVSDHPQRRGATVVHSRTPEARAEHHVLTMPPSQWSGTNE